MKQSKYAFTMIELVFIIVVLGILAAVAIPKFTTTRNDAIIAKGKADISSIRSAIVTERQSRLITGDATWVGTLDDGTGNYFIGPDVNHTLLMYGVAPGGEWTRTNGTSYDYSAGATTVTFTYSNVNGTFSCPTTGSPKPVALCRELID